MRRFPAQPGRLLRRLRRHLGAGKPLIVVSRAEAWRGEILPNRLIASHTYEVTAAALGGITLRNPWGFAHPRPLRPDTLTAPISRHYITLARPASAGIVESSRRIATPGFHNPVRRTGESQ